MSDYDGYEDYEDFYDNGPGSENFKRKMAQSANDDRESRAKHPWSHPLCTMCPVLEKQVDEQCVQVGLLEKKIERLKKRNRKLKVKNEKLNRGIR